MAMTLVGKILYMIDVFFCGLIFWRTTDMSISGRCGAALRHSNAPWWARGVSAVCNVFQSNHCEIARLADLDRAQRAISILNS
jgi:hypothetical protein